MKGEDKSRQYIVPSLDVSGSSFVEPDKVIRCEGKGEVTNIYFTNGEISVCTKPLEYMEEFLLERGYVRISETHLINIEHISHYLDDDNGRSVFMKDGAKIRIAGNKRELLQKRIEII